MVEATSEWRGCPACELFYACCISPDPVEAREMVEGSFALHVLAVHPDRLDLRATVVRVDV